MSELCRKQETPCLLILVPVKQRFFTPVFYWCWWYITVSAMMHCLRPDPPPMEEVDFPPLPGNSQAGMKWQVLLLFEGEGSEVDLVTLWGFRVLEFSPCNFSQYLLQNLHCPCRPWNILCIYDSTTRKTWTCVLCCRRPAWEGWSGSNDGDWLLLDGVFLPQSFLMPEVGRLHCHTKETGIKLRQLSLTHHMCFGNVGQSTCQGFGAHTWYGCAWG